MARLLAVISFLLSFSSLVLAQGRITCEALNSRILKQPVRYCVVLPSNYDSSQQRYPVLYFLHGLGQNEQTLFNTGGWNLVDDLRQRNQVGDFLVVAPEGRRS